VEFTTYKRLVAGLEVGKHLPDAVYLHTSALEAVPQALVDYVYGVAQDQQIAKKDWNIVKLSKRDFRFSLLNYPGFNEQSYPELHTSYSIDLQRGTVKIIDYSKSTNPPILHRKEAFVLDGHPQRKTFELITQEGERIGLYENTRRIGFQQDWLRLIASKGFHLDADGRLRSKATPIKETPMMEAFVATVERHKTAINRQSLSAPLQVLARHGYLNGNRSILDYGCGKGDDLRELEAHGLDAEGWDPVYKPGGKLEAKDIVNLGFVLNVIEDRKERDETLRTAYGYAKGFLIASVMVAGQWVYEKYTPFKDGVITSINTFQKYYSQAELARYLEDTLDTNAVAVGQGIFIVFKDKQEEQRFLLERQSVKRNWQQLSERQARIPSTADVNKLYERHQTLFHDFWETTLNLGRVPANSEFEFSEQLRRVIGSHKKALDALTGIHGPELLSEAERMRKGDVLVYFALGLFGKRKAYAYMPESLKRDIKVFFGTYTDAIHQAREKLFSVGNPQLIEGRSIESYQALKTGQLNEGHSWVLHRAYLSDLPEELRIYVGCAAQLFGDINEFDLVKIHFTSSKVSLLRYDDWSKEEPLLLERVKVRLRDQEVDVFTYGDRYELTPIENKSLYF
jgi:DNA phosphorothioation-associated putative methyltransferase